MYNENMSKENELTIEVYEKYGDKYLARNTEDVKNNQRARINNDRHMRQLEKYLYGLSKDSKIFEIGSASGRDAKLIRALGYTNITVSDVANYFLELLRKEGFSPIRFNLITDDFSEKYDFIYCWAVLVHFTKNEAKQAIKKMFEALNNNGRIALCIQSRDGYEEAWMDRDGKIGAKRYFSYWTKNELQDYMREVGFKNIEIESNIGTKSHWLECCAEKSPS